MSISNQIKQIIEKNWNNYKTDLLPKDRRMKILKDNQIKGMSSENIRFFTNEIVKKFARGGIYLEVGMYRGCSLLSAALFNPTTRCIGIDNFSSSDPENKNKDILKNNLHKFGNPKNIEYYLMDYKQAIENIFFREPNLKIDVYYYDGSHSYKDQLNGLRIMLPHLSEKCVVLIDDVNRKGPEQANQDFIRKNSDFESVFKVKTKSDNSHQKYNWWNGFEIITRDLKN